MLLEYVYIVVFSSTEYNIWEYVDICMCCYVCFISVYCSFYTVLLYLF